MRPRSDAAASRGVQTIFRPSAAPAGGWLEVNPDFAEAFAKLGLDSAAGLLELHGEIVSGHPDRHVMKVDLPGLPRAFYLKRQHTVRPSEKLRNWRAGFGWTSRSVREATVLRQLNERGLPAPRWAAVGADGRGRCFLLVEECTGAIELRERLSDASLCEADRRSLAIRLGKSMALVHAAGATTPELAAKHILVAPDGVHLSFVDWQLSRRIPVVPAGDRLRALAVLHASVPPALATPRERLRVVWAALRFGRKAGLVPGRFSDLVRRVVEESRRAAGRRSIRDQRQTSALKAQRLVWLAGEAVCTTPAVAAHWPYPPIGPPFYDEAPGVETIRLPDGRDALLVRGRSTTPLGRLRAWLRGRSWRSPGVCLGRLLFHLERYGVPAPRLLAFGQRLTGPISADWFALHTPRATLIESVLTSAEAGRLGRLLRQLHDAGCSLTGEPLLMFGRGEGGFCVRDLAGVRLREPNASRELGRLAAALPPELRSDAIAGYQAGPQTSPPVSLPTGDRRITTRAQRVDAIQ